MIQVRFWRISWGTQQHTAFPSPLQCWGSSSSSQRGTQTWHCPPTARRPQGSGVHQCCGDGQTNECSRTNMHIHALTDPKINNMTGTVAYTFPGKLLWRWACHVGLPPWAGWIWQNQKGGVSESSSCSAGVQNIGLRKMAFSGYSARFRLQVFILLLFNIQKVHLNMWETLALRGGIVEPENSCVWKFCQTDF